MLVPKVTNLDSFIRVSSDSYRRVKAGPYVIGGSGHPGLTLHLAQIISNISCYEADPLKESTRMTLHLTLL